MSLSFASISLFTHVGFDSEMRPTNGTLRESAYHTYALGNSRNSSSNSPSDLRLTFGRTVALGEIFHRRTRFDDALVSAGDLDALLCDKRRRSSAENDQSARGMKRHHRSTNVHRATDVL